MPHGSGPGESQEPSHVRKLFADENDKGRTPGPDSLVGEGSNTNLNAYLSQYAGGTVNGPGKDGELIDLKGAWFAD